MGVATVFDRELSLEAMWHAYRASDFVAQNSVAVDTGVVCDLLQARYYDSGRGQFVSQDPVFWELGLTSDGRNALLNPQALNSYSYANDNPITNKDPWGRDAFNYSRPIPGLLSPYYGHGFVSVVPRPGENLPSINSNGMCIDTSRPFTLGAYPVGVRLTTAANNQTDYSIASANQSLPGVARVPIVPPFGMTPSDYDRSLVNVFNATQPDQGLYDPTGSRLIDASNSNNANTYFVTKAGVQAGQMNSIKANLQASNQRPAPGLGTSISSPATLQSTLSSLSSALKTLSSLLPSAPRSR